MLEFGKSVLGNLGPQAVATQRAEKNIDQIRRDVYDSHRHRVYALAYYMTGDELSAEDLLARCFTRAFAGKEAPDGADVDASLLAELRRDGVLGEIELREAPEVGVSGAAGGNILRTDLEEAVRGLPAGERLVFLLSDVEGYSAARVAALTGRREAEIARAVLGARLRLREATAAARKKREASARAQEETEIAGDADRS